MIFDSRTPRWCCRWRATPAPRTTPATTRPASPRPLDRREAEFEQVAFNDIKNANGEALTPASADRVMVVGARWYFRELTGSLQKRFYYDSLFGKLVFRGRLNDLEGGDPNLTATRSRSRSSNPNVLSDERLLGAAGTRQ
ncbi:MAG: hypothetical protein H7A45_13570 [Verrucomicrobiales bacterium]|nr:hypothetical protein [Verrucomicrobiales bacterium]